MTKAQLLACEAKRLNKLYLLPNYWKKIALIIFLLSIAGLLFLKSMEGEFVILKDLARKGFLVGMLLFTISKDKIEDELTSKLRAQSFSLAFVCGVGYTLVQPYINYAAKYFIKPEKAIFAEVEVFVILWFMLLIQMLFFYTLKAAR